MFIDSDTKYYVCDLNNGKIVTYNEIWEYQSNKGFTEPAYMKQVDKDVYISTGTAIIEADKNLSVLATFNISGFNRGIHFDEQTDTILAVKVFSHINIFDRNLTLLGNITTYPDYPYNLEYHNGFFFIGTTTNKVLKMQNKTIISSFITNCTGGINSVLLDDFDYIAVACYLDKMVYLYHTNGTYMNKYISTLFVPKDIKVDSKGRFIIASKPQIDIYN
jgi:hypothetical protein